MVYKHTQCLVIGLHNMSKTWLVVITSIKGSWMASELRGLPAVLGVLGLITGNCLLGSACAGLVHIHSIIPRCLSSQIAYLDLASVDHTFLSA